MYTKGTEHEEADDGKKMNKALQVCRQWPQERASTLKNIVQLPFYVVCFVIVLLVSIYVAV